MNPEQVLQRTFAFDAFRPGQDRIVASILKGRDVVVVMPTGGGKSLCYQLPALLMEGVTLVVSPLIALMKDQVDALRARRIRATFINSSISGGEQAERLAAMARGQYKLVYIAPERFRDPRLVEALRPVPLSLVAVDEAHCVSLWGHDFRPDYLRIGESVQAFGSPPVAAFTATATPEVRDDIITALRLRDPELFVTGFERPNLEFRVSHLSRISEKLARLSRIVEAHGTGIVYCATRRRVEEVTEHFAAWDVSAIPYHGGMEDGQREAAQDVFMTGRAGVAVATNAFGMGIDRADIRFVVHFEMPGSVEALYQEAGRAGRDGLPAVCELLYGARDQKIQEFFIEGNNPTPPVVRDVYATLRRMADPVHEICISLQDLAKQFQGKVNPMAVSSSVYLLARLRVLERFDIPGLRIRGTRLLSPGLGPRDLPLDVEALADKERRDRRKLRCVIDYAHSAGCRQEWILRYFGETKARPCLRCDSCRSRRPENLRRAQTEEELMLLRKALSGVARMSYRGGPSGWRPRFGRNRVIEMLIGSKRAEILQYGLDQLSTYGLLRGEGTAYLKLLFTAMERAELLKTAKGEYPMITLTAFGEKVMQGKKEGLLAWPPRSPRPSTEKPGASGERHAAEDFGWADLALLKVLKKKRSELARARGNRPAYTIFSNRTLKALAAVQPLTVEEARDLPGIGTVKTKTLLPSFLKLIATHHATHHINVSTEE